MITKVLNTYIKYYFVFDCVLSIIFILIYELVCYKYHVYIEFDASNLNSLLNELISSSVAVGGFIIAVLTIILTMKESVKEIDIYDSKSGFDLLFLSKHYKRIVDVFFGASAIFVLTFFCFSLLEIFFEELTNKTIAYLIFIGLIIMTLAIIRCLIVLKGIVELQIKR